MTDLDSRLTEYDRLLESGLDSLLDAQPPFRPLYNMIAYHFGRLNENFTPRTARAGKSIRPALCFLSCESVRERACLAVPGALAVELLHNFSLVHDDIQDGSELRRHRAAVWRVWGVPQAINVGDGLFALAHLALATGKMEDDARSQVELAFSRTCLELCEGQFLDLSFRRDRRPTLEDYRLMATKKTASLFGCATEIGAILGAADAETVRTLRRFGRLIGEAFQVCDDILGVWGDEQRTGKPADDIRDRQLGLPIVLALAQADGTDLERLTTLYAGTAPLSDSEVHWVTELFDRTDIRRQAAARAEELFSAAEKLLTSGLPHEHADNLRNFVGRLRPL
jgi:geranylgeranyl diphosphate synthase, type I